MIGYLSGTLKRLDATRAVVLAGGVGYEVHISLSTYYELEGHSQVELDVYTHVREDALALYGFASAEEKLAFEKLISISGIGPTLAQKILSGISPSDLADAISRGDARKLATIPGVGRKTAERMCLELRDKLAVAEKPATPATARSTVDDDVQSALINLGYRPKDAETALDAARKEMGADAELSALLKAALRQLTRRFARHHPARFLATLGMTSVVGFFERHLAKVVIGELANHVQRDVLAAVLLATHSHASE